MADTDNAANLDDSSLIEPENLSEVFPNSSELESFYGQETLPFALDFKSQVMQRISEEGIFAENILDLVIEGSSIGKWALRKAAGLSYQINDLDFSCIIDSKDQHTDNILDYLEKVMFEEFGKIYIDNRDIFARRYPHNPFCMVTNVRNNFVDLSSLSDYSSKALELLESPELVTSNDIVRMHTLLIPFLTTNKVYSKQIRDNLKMDLGTQFEMFENYIQQYISLSKKAEIKHMISFEEMRSEISDSKFEKLNTVLEYINSKLIN